MAPSTIIGYTSVDITPPPIFFVCTPKHQVHVGTFHANQPEPAPPPVTKPLHCLFTLTNLHPLPFLQKTI